MATREMPSGNAYSAGEIDPKISGIQGAIRAGRPLEGTGL
jgi:hypothetical protein